MSEQCEITPGYSLGVSFFLLARTRRGDGENADGHPLLCQLTPREFQVLGMIVEGKASKEIAVLLNLGMETVRSCRKSMMKKLGVNNVRSHQGRRSPASPADPADNTGNVETIWIGRAIGCFVTCVTYVTPLRIRGTMICGTMRE